MKKDLKCYYNWAPLTEKQFFSTVREFVDNGFRKFVITDPLLRQMIESEDRIKLVKKICSDMEVEFSAVHGFYGKWKGDLNCTSKEHWDSMYEDHIKGMKIAAEFGCKSYVVHVGAAEYCYDHIPVDKLRPLAVAGVEKLLPTARELDMVIAVENSQEATNTAAEVRKIVDVFGDDPHVGVCYDTGHANMLASAPGKSYENIDGYMNNVWWEDGVVLEDNALETLRDKVVTCHIHDNNGYADNHGMPFDGTINWRELMPKLFDCPRMIDYQTEVCFDDGCNWAGKLLAPAGGYSIRRLADTFRYLGF